MNIYYEAAIWLGMALIASVVSIRVAVPVALVEIVVGAGAGNIPGLKEKVTQPEFVAFLATRPRCRRRGGTPRCRLRALARRPRARCLPHRPRRPPDAPLVRRTRRAGPAGIDADQPRRAEAQARCLGADANVEDRSAGHQRLPGHGVGDRALIPGERLVGGVDEDLGIEEVGRRWRRGDECVRDGPAAEHLGPPPIGIACLRHTLSSRSPIRVGP